MLYNHSFNSIENLLNLNEFVILFSTIWHQNLNLAIILKVPYLIKNRKINVIQS